MEHNPCHVGTSGWTYADWAGRFYPPQVRGAERLSYYAGRFDTVEVNATFYRFPGESMVRAWNRRLPADFHLVLKGNRRVTHLNRLAGSGETLAGFLERVRPLKHLRVLLWQLPPTLRKDLPRLEEFLALLPSRWRHAVEFRHESWWDDGVAALLARHGAAFVAVSHPHLPETVLATADFLYVRFHGLGAALHGYDYGGEELRAWADRLAPHRAGRTLYAFFNNDREARAVHNAAVFRALLDAAQAQPPSAVST